VSQAAGSGIPMNGHDVTVRCADRDDAQALSVLCGQLGYERSVLSIARALATMRPEGCGARALLVAERVGKVVGWIEVERKTGILHDGDDAEITGLVVADDSRSKGVGAALLAEAERWAMREGVTKMLVRSNVIRSRAHEFYLRRGYSEAKRQAVFEKQLKGTK